VAITSLGCARNDVDSEELAGRLQAGGWTLVADPSEADVAVVNTCGFVEQAKQDSVDTLLEAARLKDGGLDGRSRTQAVVAVGCLAERYGAELAGSLPEADAVLGFDSYADMSGHLSAILAGERPASHVPRDRRSLLPLSPVARQAARAGTAVPGTGVAPSGLAPAPGARPTAEVDRPSLSSVAPASGPPVVRARLGSAPWASLEDRLGLRPPVHVLRHPGLPWLVRLAAPHRGAGRDALARRARGARGLPGQREHHELRQGPRRPRPAPAAPPRGRGGRRHRAGPGLLPAAGRAAAGPARGHRHHARGGALLRPVVPARVGDPAPPDAALRRQRRLPGPGRPGQGTGTDGGIRSNVIVGFPGETEADVEELVGFLSAARLDVVGVFGYSDEDGTEAETYDGKHDPEEVAARVERVSALVDELVAQRAEDRVGEVVDVLVEEVLDRESAAEVHDLLPARGPAPTGDAVVSGRAAHQGPEVDGTTAVLLPHGTAAPVGSFVRAVVVTTDGADLVAAPGPAPEGGV
jgi:hypothetical protein